MPVFALADCNNFFASCERVFRPDLRNAPIVVLSNNDGCVVSRSNESKALGIKMGEPYFKIKGFLEQNGVSVFSSNFPLYGDLSNRVMSILSSYSPSIDIYSIDECFMDFSSLPRDYDLADYARQIVRRVYKCVSIPISIGIAPTKTLAKIASKFAKKYPGYEGACYIRTDEQRLKALSLTPIGDVWGIGRRVAPKLAALGVATAGDFAALPAETVRRNFNITVQRTYRELRGESCISLEQGEYRKSICFSRSFSDRGISDLKELEAEVAAFASACAGKLRRYKCACSQLTAFAHTSRFITGAGTHFIVRSARFYYPTCDSGEIVSCALAALRGGYAPGTHYYKKAGVALWDITSSKNLAPSLFDDKDREKQAALNAAVDAINRKEGSGSVRLAIEAPEIKADRGFMSKRYSTDLRDVLILNCN